MSQSYFNPRDFSKDRLNNLQSLMQSSTISLDLHLLLLWPLLLFEGV